MGNNSCCEQDPTQQYLDADNLIFNTPRRPRKAIETPLSNCRIVETPTNARNNPTKLYMRDSYDTYFNFVITDDVYESHDDESDVESQISELSMETYPTASTYESISSLIAAYLIGKDANRVQIPLSLSITTEFGREVDCDIAVDIDLEDIHMESDSVSKISQY